MASLSGVMAHVGVHVHACRRSLRTGQSREIVGRVLIDCCLLEIESLSPLVPSRQYESESGVR